MVESFAPAGAVPGNPETVSEETALKVNLALIALAVKMLLGLVTLPAGVAVVAAAVYATATALSRLYIKSVVTRTAIRPVPTSLFGDIHLAFVMLRQ